MSLLLSPHVTLERSFFFLLTYESFVCKTWRMIWLQLHGSKARTNQLVSSCGSVDEPHVPLGAAKEPTVIPVLIPVRAQPSPSTLLWWHQSVRYGRCHEAL